MNLREQIKLFTDGDGLISPYNLEQPGVQKNASGNGVLYLGEYIVLLNRYGILEKTDKFKFIITMLSCMPSYVGLLYRSPTHPDQEGPDDYVGYLVAAYFCDGKDLAQHTIDYAKSHWGFLNNDSPGSYRFKDGRFNWSAFLVRQPQLIALAYWAAGKKPFFLTVWWTALVLALAGRGKPTFDTDARILAWLMAQVACKESWLCRKAFGIFANRLAKDYPIDENGRGGMTKVFNIAFGGRNPEHPFAIMFPSI